MYMGPEHDVPAVDVVGVGLNATDTLIHVARFPARGAKAAYQAEVVQAGGKHVTAWAVQGDLDVSTVNSNHFEMEWPPRSGRMQSFPEVDRAVWSDVPGARRRLVPVPLPCQHPSPG